jgi:hypothetical protein
MRPLKLNAGNTKPADEKVNLSDMSDDDIMSGLFDEIDDEEFDQYLEEESSPPPGFTPAQVAAMEEAPPKPTKASVRQQVSMPEMDDGAGLLGLSVDEIQALPRIDTRLPHATGRLIVEVLQQSKPDYEATGTGTAVLLAQFPQAISIEALRAFKKSCGVRMTRLKRAARNQGQEVSNFVIHWETITPIGSDPNKSNYWLLRIIRMDEDNWSVYRSTIGGGSKGPSRHTREGINLL